MALKAGRYGQLLEVQAAPDLVSAGPEINMLGNTFSLQQSGLDTQWIDRLYRVHYLQNGQAVTP